jgi:predicted RNase H-like nuclease (RuvC/YqgF family)
MVSIFRKKEASEPCLSVEEPLVILRELEKEEVSLMEEKRELLALKEKLQLKANEKIEIMKLRTQTLKNEISELRRQCEELEKFVSASNNSQTSFS